MRRLALASSLTEGVTKAAQSRPDDVEDHADVPGVELLGRHLVEKSSADDQGNEAEGKKNVD